MKEHFFGYFKPSHDDFKKLWDESIFAFDANILLNLYRYSEATRNELLKVIEMLNDRVWLPYQATEEYLRNRISTTGGQAKEYDEVRSILNNLLTNLGNNKRHPFISEVLFKELESIFEKVEEEFKNNQKTLNERIYSDEIQNKLAELFENKIGKSFTQKELEEIYKEGKQRYENQIPPGFKDGNKDKSSNLYRKFGDLIIWNELIYKSKSENKNIIFVTDDKKDDWWLEYSGKTIGPLPSLLHEFNEKTSRSFYMYTAEQFMKAATEFSNEKIEEEVITELKEFRQYSEQLGGLFEIDNDDFAIKVNQNIKLIGKVRNLAKRRRLGRTTSEEEVLNWLLEYSKLIGKNRVIILNNFLADYIANNGIDIDYAIEIIHFLNNKGIIELYIDNQGDFPVQAIKLK